MTKTSSLIGQTPSEVDFRRVYRAAIVAVQKGGKNVPISTLVFGSGDVLVLQVAEDSPLLKVPPPDFYKRLTESSGEGGRVSRTNSFVNILTKGLGSHQRRPSDVDKELPSSINDEMGGKTNPFDGSHVVINAASGEDIGLEVDENAVDQLQQAADNEANSVWKDLQVVFLNKNSSTSEGNGVREFLTAMEVAPKSNLARTAVSESGLDKLPGVFLVSIDRPSNPRLRDDKNPKKSKVTVITSPVKQASSDNNGGDDRSDVRSLATLDQVFTAIAPDTPLQEGDVLGQQLQLVI